MTVAPGQAWPGSLCSKCRASILWAATINGKMQPLDAVPNDAGNLRLIPEWVATERGALQRVHVVKPDVTLSFDDDGVRYMPHHATCPFADEFRKPKKAS
jgi:hypothetical protein